MLAVHFLVGKTVGDALRFLQRLLRFNGETFQIHVFDIGASGGSVKQGEGEAKAEKLVRSEKTCVGEGESPSGPEGSFRGSERE